MGIPIDLENGVVHIHGIPSISEVICDMSPMK